MASLRVSFLLVMKWCVYQLRATGAWTDGAVLFLYRSPGDRLHPAHLNPNFDHEGHRDDRQEWPDEDQQDPERERMGPACPVGEKPDIASHVAELLMIGWLLRHGRLSFT
jgi:hypothetical protein